MAPEQNHDYKIQDAAEDCSGYQIWVKGQISSALLDWFEDLQVETLENGDTLLHIPTTDQAFLFGVLLRLRDLGIYLISVSPLTFPIKGGDKV